MQKKLESKTAKTIKFDQAFSNVTRFNSAFQSTMNNRNKVYISEDEKADSVRKSIDKEVESVINYQNSQMRKITGESSNTSKPQPSITKKSMCLEEYTDEDDENNDSKSVVEFGYMLADKHMPELEIATLLEKQVAALTRQLNEFKRGLERNKTKLKEETEKVILNQTQIFNLENEIVILKKKAINGTNNYMKHSVYNNIGDNKSKNDEIRRSILTNNLTFDDDEAEDEVKIKEDKWSFDYIVMSIIHSISEYLPFKKDIRNIRAKFGSSVASYFLFYRFVYVFLFLFFLFKFLFNFFFFSF
jgi:hypothetical protein